MFWGFLFFHCRTRISIDDAYTEEEGSHTHRMDGFGVNK